MKLLSPSAERICVIALTHFADRGYDASSLNDIAVTAGMRKPSLYAHFASKDALFDAAWTMALASERIYVEACFANKPALDKLPGKCYTEQLSERYEKSPSLRFLLRTAFFPPAELRPTVTAGFEDYLERMGELFNTRLICAYPALLTEEVSLFRDAYIALIDSLHVELIYGNQLVYARRLTALWRILGDSLTLTVKGATHG